jgi:plastocyanin
MIRRRNTPVVAAALLVAAWALVHSGSPVDVLGSLLAAGAEAQGGTATIAGTIHFEGEAPAPNKLKMGSDPGCKIHGEDVFAENVVVNDNGTVRWVMVCVKSGLGEAAFDAPKDPVVLDQEGCTYRPHVFGIMAGQPLEIRNSDDTLHNVHAHPEVNKAFNIAQPMKGMKTIKSFDKAEAPFRIVCDVHPWMSTYACVFDHPFFGVTGEDGRYAIEDLPPGTYIIET